MEIVDPLTGNVTQAATTALGVVPILVLGVPGEGRIRHPREFVQAHTATGRTCFEKQARRAFPGRSGVVGYVHV